MYQLNPNLRDFWHVRKPYKLLKGGRFSSKTQDAGGMAAYLARNYSVKFLCIRQFQNRIADSVYTVIKEKIEQAGWASEFTIGVSTIRHNVTGSEFLFYGMARNINDIKGTEGVDICWIEEGESLTAEQWEVIDPTIRKEGSEIWLLWNPKYVSDFVQTKLPRLLGDDCILKHINYDQNPFLSSTARAKAERLKEADPESYAHIYLGQALSDDERVIIKLSWIESAIDAHVKLGIEVTGKTTVGYDVADSGKDLCANVVTKGIVTIAAEEWKAAEDELNESCRRTYNNALKHNGAIRYDSIGVGAHSGSEFKSINTERYLLPDYTAIEYEGYNAGGAVRNPDSIYGETEVLNKDFFENVKAQDWWTVADRFRNTYNAVTKGMEFAEEDLISISSEIGQATLDKLKEELSTPRRDFSKGGKVKVESKADMAKRDVVSPNLADSFIMSNCHTAPAQTLMVL